MRALPRLLFEPGELRGSFGPGSAWPVGKPPVLASWLLGTAPRPVSLGRGEGGCGGGLLCQGALFVCRPFR